ncbi:hypothetical protein Riv7116_3132 [Rivularia sp. PCC 7116]|uniref:hypothetical protein n=1 Tax=Rivularia sp. PCC 7116 TaxID=373994 RepID=UPI00029F29DD|nr:hypothetical protein [Rivularia sp. PCC 7116]AFY55605.1 hypothetical protein Riv7116_3132 [Rivularia sp. PCC 7116]
MIKILPTEKFKITTYLRPDRVEDKLLNFVEPYKLVRFSFPFGPSSDKPYEGTIENFSFRIQRISKYKKRNSLPVIEGIISPQERGSLINVTIKPNQILNLFMSVFPLFYISISMVVGFSLFLHSDNDARSMGILFLLSPLWMIIVSFFTIKSFKFDVQQDKNFLLELFE